jgi:hypothetical protein
MISSLGWHSHPIGASDLGPSQQQNHAGASIEPQRLIPKNNLENQINCHIMALIKRNFSFYWHHALGLAFSSSGNDNNILVDAPITA